MKKISRVFSLALAAICTLCLCSFGIAFEVGADDSYTITLTKPNTSYSFAGHTYKAYKVFDVTVNPDRTAYTYTVTADCLGYGTAAVSGNKYTLNSTDYSQSTITSEAIARSFAEALKTNYFASTPTYNKNDASLIATKICGADYSDATAVLTLGTNSGYYLIIDEYAGTATVTSLVMLDTAANQNTSHTGYDSGNVANININVKADAPANVDDKQVRVQTTPAEAFAGYTDSETGQTVEFLITAKIPNIDVKNYAKYDYQIVDTIDPCFTVNTNSLHIYKTLTENTLSDEVTVTGASISAITPSGVNGKNQYLINFGDIHSKVTFGNSVEVGDLFYTGETVYISYTAKFNGSVNNTAIKYYPSNATTDGTNMAHIKYNNNPYDNSKYYESTIDTDSYVWTFGFDFTKVKRDDTAATLTALSGAEFKVYNIGASEDTSTAGTEMRFKKVADGTYCVVNNTDELTANPTGAVGEIINTLPVSTAGKLYVYGFDKGVNYKLVESKAPNGYGLADPTIFKVNSVTYGANGASITNATYKVNGNNVVGSGEGAARFGTNKEVSTNSASIWNMSGSELVGTGGIGTTIFYVAGGILMAGAAVLLITKLRMRGK